MLNIGNASYVSIKCILSSSVNKSLPITISRTIEFAVALYGCETFYVGSEILAAKVRIELCLITLCSPSKAKLYFKGHIRSKRQLSANELHVTITEKI
jgi:hypothetical protein